MKAAIVYTHPALNAQEPRALPAASTSTGTNVLSQMLQHIAASQTLQNAQLDIMNNKAAAQHGVPTFQSYTTHQGCTNNTRMNAEKQVP